MGNSEKPDHGVNSRVLDQTIVDEQDHGHFLAAVIRICNVAFDLEATTDLGRALLDFQKLAGGVVTIETPDVVQFGGVHQSMYICVVLPCLSATHGHLEIDQTKSPRNNEFHREPTRKDQPGLGIGWRLLLRIGSRTS